jgi:hypothetical protein
LPGTLLGKELIRLGFEVVKSKKGNGRLGIGLKEPPAKTGAFANKRSMSMTLLLPQWSRQKSAEAATANSKATIIPREGRGRIPRWQEAGCGPH